MSAQTPVDLLAWPLSDEPYRYFTNVETAGAAVTTARGAWGTSMLALDGVYPEVVAERRQILATTPHRVGALPHTVAAQWDALEFLFGRAAADFPDIVTFTPLGGERFRYRNLVTGTTLELTVGDPETLSTAPLVAAAAELAEDLFLLDDRDGGLHLDAVAATFTGAWSSTFALGMSFSDLHGPVPRVHGSGMVDRTERFLRAMEPGAVVRRLNWSIYESDELDAALESAAHRPPERTAVVARAGAFGDLRLRVEVQHLVRLPRTGALLFTINTQLTPLSELVTVPPWRRQLRATVAELPLDMARYKNFGDFRDQLLAWLDAQS